MPKALFGRIFFIAVALMMFASSQAAAFTVGDFACQPDTDCAFQPCGNPYALPIDQIDTVTNCCPDGSSNSANS